MADDFKGFKRLNFFTGFQTTADDWNDLVRYQVEKHKLHNRLFHGPGVLPGALGGLKVAARGRADLSVEVATGYAIDGEGNDIYVAEPEIKTLNPGDFKLPATAYLVVKYAEDLTDFVSYKANLEYKGHRRVAEKVKIDWIITEPDIAREVELCRVQLTKDVKRITDAKDPAEPKANEIDLRFVPAAGVVGTTLAPAMLRDLQEMLGDARQVYGHMFHSLRILTASDVLNTVSSLDLFMRLGLVDKRNLPSLFEMLFDNQEALIQDVEANYPQFSSKKEFASFKKHVELLQNMFQEGGFSQEFLVNVVGYQKKSTENLTTIFSAKLKQKAREAEPAALGASEAVLEKLKVRSDELGPTLDVEGVKLKLSDTIDVLEKRSEADHKFRIVDARDKYRTRQKLKYPDGVIVEDVGVAFEGGYAEWECSNIVPNKDVIVLMRTDYVHGDWEAEVTVNGKKIPNCVCKGDDRRFRWRNWPFKIPAEYVGDTFLSIRLTPITADRDVNLFRLWFYQPA
ncbi:MAG: hypothetical protein H6744_04505 [Deltaproteobacteria bacterium]|nr:hypothetical protein [Deltaproteobacteria bacterium]MCB9785936.1 hypothetical protein [Deltaproteobacteria bacterium]